MDSEDYIQWGLGIFRGAAGYPLEAKTEEAFSNHYMRVARLFQAKDENFDELKAELEFWLTKQGQAAGLLTSIGRGVSVSPEAFAEAVSMVEKWKPVAATPLCT